jgi:hypothetical protein
MLSGIEHFGVVSHDTGSYLAEAFARRHLAGRNARSAGLAKTLI